MFPSLPRRLQEAASRSPLPKRWEEPAGGFFTHSHKCMHIHRPFPVLQRKTLCLLKQHTHMSPHTTHTHTHVLKSGHCANYDFCSQEFLLTRIFISMSRLIISLHNYNFVFEHMIYHICLYPHCRITHSCEWCAWVPQKRPFFVVREIQIHLFSDWLPNKLGVVCLLLKKSKGNNSYWRVGKHL